MRAIFELLLSFNLYVFLMILKTLCNRFNQSLSNKIHITYLKPENITNFLGVRNNKIGQKN